ncbi:MAG: DUF2905 domain-containing protein [Acidobacteriota bacterium]|jgi:hypothetical protein
MFTDLGKLLIILGLVIAALGCVLVFFPSLRLGRLPGDFTIQLKHGTIFIPLGTCILLSVVLTLILWLVNWLRR